MHHHAYEDRLSAGAPPLTEVPRVAFIDMNSYYAAVVQTVEPEYEGKPLIITQVDSPVSPSIAVSTEAKAYGVKRGMSQVDALTLCPEILMVAAGDLWHRLFKDWHFEIREIFGETVPEEELLSYSVDEMAWVPAKLSSTSYMTDSLHLCKEGLHKVFGETLTASIGLAPNIGLAKMASEMKKPNGFVVFGEDYTKQLFQCALDDVPDIGPKTKAHLNSQSIFTIEDLWARSASYLQRTFPSLPITKFFYMLRGYRSVDYDQPESEKRSIGKGYTLPPELRTAKHSTEHIYQALSLVLSRLRRQSLMTNKLSATIYLKGNTPDQKMTYQDVTISTDSYANDDLFWFSTIRKGLNDLYLPSTHHPFSISVQALNLIATEDMQGSLFSDERRIQEINLVEKVDALRAQQFPIGLATTYFSKDLIPFRNSFGPPERD